MKQYLLNNSRSIIIVLLLLVIALSYSTNGWGQTPGLIIKPASAPGNLVLDPDGDGYVSQKTGGVQLGFTNPPFNDVTQSEIPYVAIIRPDPLSDILRGPVGGFCEIVGVDEAGNNAILVHNDGTNLLFRFRLGGYAPNSKSYSILMDTDGKFGFSGVNSDPHPINGNPGFEVEVVLKTNFSVDVYNVDGLSTGTLSATYSYDTHCQKSMAVTMGGSGTGDPDYFYDFYIPLSDLAVLGVTPATPLRIVAVTTMNPQAAIGNNALSDIGGVTSGSNIDQIFTDLIEAQTPTPPGQEVLDRSDCPAIKSPMGVGATSISGTTTELGNPIIRIYKNGVYLGQTTASSGVWTYLNSNMNLLSGDIISATAHNTGEGESKNECNATAVGAECSSPPYNITVLTANKGVTFSIEVTGPTIISVYEDNSGVFGVWGSLTVNSSGTYTIQPSTQGQSLTGGTHYMVAQGSGLCLSKKVYFCVEHQVIVSTAPAITTSPAITTPSTSISGTGITGSVILLYANGVEIGTTTISSGTTWTIPVSGLSACDRIEARQIENGECVSSVSNAVTVTQAASPPQIFGNYCTTSSVTSISGYSAEAANAIVYVYLNGSSTASGNSTVNIYGNWTVASLSIPPGTTVTAKVTDAINCKTLSDPSNSIVIGSQSANNAVITGPVNEDQTSVSGIGTDGAIVKLYIDNGFIGEATVSGGGWTISTMVGAFNELYPGGNLTVTTTTGSNCESTASSAMVVQCVTPLNNQSISKDATEYCQGDNGIITLTNSQNMVIYTPVLASNHSTIVGYSAIGTGGTITMQTNALAVNQTITVKAQKISSVSCESFNVNTLDLVVIPLPNITYTLLPDIATTCEGNTIAVTLSDTESSNFSYFLADAVTGAVLSTTVNGTGAGITITSTPIYTNNSIKVVATNITTGCSADLTDRVIVTISGPDINVPVTVGQSVICNSQSTTISVATQNNASYTYTVRNSGGTVIGSFTGNGSVRSVSTGPLASSQSYYVEITDNSASGCGTKQLVNTVNITVTQISLSGNITPVSCFGQSNGSVSVTPSGGTAPYSYLWSSGETTATLSGKSAGNYTVTVTDNTGCTASSVYTISSPAALLEVYTTSVVNVSISGSSDGTIEVSASGGTSPYQYSKDGTNFQSSGLFGSLTEGTYTFTVKDANGCTATTSGTVGAPGQLLVVGIISNVGCYGGSNGTITVTQPATGVAPYYYSIDDGVNYQSSNVFSGLNAGTYTIKIKDSNSPIATGAGSFIVEQPPLLSSSASITPVSCYNGSTGSIDLSVSGGIAPYTYDWNTDGSGDFDDLQDIGSLPAGTYAVTVKDANNCTLTANYTVSQPGLLSVSGAVTDVVTAVATTGGVIATITGGTGPYTYLWNSNPEQTTKDLVNVGAGSYTLTVTDALGCGVTQPFYVAGPVVQSAACSYNVSDAFGTSYSNSTGLINWVGPWTETNDNNSITTGWILESSRAFTGMTGNIMEIGAQTKNQSLTGNVSVSRAINLDGVSSINVKFKYAVKENQNNGNGSIIVYIGSVFSIPIAISNSLNTTTFDQTISSGLASNSTIRFVLTGPIVDNLLLIDDLIITYNKDLNLTAIPSKLTCNDNNSGSIATTVTGGHIPYTYAWTGPNSYSSSVKDPTDLSAGVYHLTLTGSGGCVINADVTVSEPSPLSILESVTNVSCYGGTTGAIDISPIGGTPPYTYDWTTDGTGDYDDLQDLTGKLAGTYSVTVRDAKGCTYSKAIVISQPTQLSATISNAPMSCNNTSDGTITFGSPAGGSGTYQFSIDNGANWYPVGGTTSSYTFTGLGAATHQLRIRDFNTTSCVVSFTDLTFTNPTEITGSIQSTNVQCHGGNNGTITILASGGSGSYHYSIDGGTNWSSSNFFNGLTASTRNVRVRDANRVNCYSILNSALVISEPAVLNATVTSGNITCNGASDGTITVSSPLGGSGNYEYSINGGSSWQASGSFTGLGDGTFNVMMRDKNFPACTQALSSSLILSQPAVLTGSVSKTNTHCTGSSDGTIVITAGGGNGNYDFSIDGGSNWFTGLSPKTFMVSAGTYDVRIRISGVTNCELQLNGGLNITEPSPISIQSQNHTNITCNGVNDGAISISATGGIAPYIFTLSLGGTSNSTGSFSGLSPGTYSVSVTDSYGCTSATSNSFIINATPAPIAFAGNDLITCTGASAISMTGASATGSYAGVPTWSGGTGTWVQNPDPALATFTPTGINGSFTATLILTGANGCSNATDSRTVTWGAISPYFIDPQGTSSCAEDNVVYSTQSDMFNYVWSIQGEAGKDYIIISGGIGTTDHTVTLKWLTSGSKIVTVNYSDNGCTGTPATSTITVHPMPTVGSFN